ncbi:MAG: hypothetical protein IT566_04180 [Rhodospirillaceae bacterium]|nr:hypothetical protein [Rhodospirillaceae bacterium]
MPHDSDPALPHSLMRRLAISVRLVVMGGLVLVGLVSFLAFLLIRAADERGRALLAEELDHSTATIADALAPVLRAATPGDAALLTEAMTPYASTDRALRLFFTPAEGGARGVFFIAGAPVQAVAQTESEAGRIVTGGALGDFTAACTPARPASDGHGASLWAVTPVASPSGCWRLVASRGVVGAGTTFLALPPIRSTGLAAAAAAVLMIAAAVLALAQTRRLRQLGDFTQTFAEITAGPDPGLLPPPANDEAAASLPAGPEPASAQILDLKRSVVDLSAAVIAYTDAARVKLGADGGQLKTDIAQGLTIDGRVDFVRTILEDLLGPALRAPLSGHPIIVTLKSDDMETRPAAMLSITTPPLMSGDDLAGDARGRLSLIKQFVAALGAVATLEARAEAEAVLLRFPLSARHCPAQKDAG